MGTLDIKNFPAHGVSDEDTFLMTDAKNGFVAGSMTLKDMKEKVITRWSRPYHWITSCDLKRNMTLSGKRKKGHCMLFEKTGNWIRTYIGSLPDGGRHAGKFG